MTWLVSAVATPPTAHDTKAEADREVIRLAPTKAVAWFCTGIEETPDVPQATVTAPPAPTGVVERVLGHLGMVLPTGEGIG